MLVTIFTPTYNRAQLLPRVFESLKQQDCLDFEWIVVDDGSTDDTEQVIHSLMTENVSFPIFYIKKENGGKHSAVNIGVTKAKGILFFIVDSDDYLPSNAIRIVTEEWKLIQNEDSFCGVAGLDCYIDGRIVGSGLGRNQLNCNAMEIRYKYHVTGDLKEVFLTKILKAYPFPEIPNERFCPEQLNWFRIAQKYQLHYFNKPIYIVEYLEGGLTDGITSARMNSPIASCMTYQEMLNYPIPFSAKIKAAINYWRFRFCINPQTSLFPRINGLWNILMPLGWMMHLKDKRS